MAPLRFLGLGLIALPYQSYGVASRLSPALDDTLTILRYYFEP